jgi:hypothetical protein
MSTEEEYRRQAAYAEERARAATLDSDRESWLRIAQGWMSLLRKRPQSDAEAFNDQSAARPPFLLCRGPSAYAEPMSVEAP